MNPYRSNNTFVLDQTLTAEQGFDLFIKALAKQENVAPDLLGDITILSRSEGHYPFAVKWGHFDGTYAGTPCVRKDGNLYKRPRTSGTYQVSCRRVYSLSDQLEAACCLAALFRENGKLPDHLNLLVGVEQYLSEHFNRFQDDTHIGTAEAVDEISDALLKRKNNRYRNSVDTICHRTATDRVGGDEVEKLEYDWRSTSEGDELLYLPLLVVEYAYRGQNYTAVVPLIKDCCKPLLTYPYYYKVQALESAAYTETATIRHGGLYGFGFWVGMAIFGFLGIWTRSGGGLFPSICTAIAVVLAALGITQLVLGFINTSRARGVAAEYRRRMDEAAAQQEQTLQRQTAAFFAVYNGAASIESGRQAAASAASLPCEDGDIAYCCIDCVDSDHTQTAIIGAVKPIKEGKALLGVALVGIVACLLYFVIGVGPVHNLEKVLSHTLYQGESGGVFGDGYHLEFRDGGEDHLYTIGYRGRSGLIAKFECVVVDGETITVDGETVTVRYDEEYVTFTPSFVDRSDYSVWRFDQRAEPGDRTGNFSYDDGNSDSNITITTTKATTATKAPTTTTTTEAFEAEPTDVPETTDTPDANVTSADDPCADGHSYEDGGCTTPPICSRCKMVLGEPLGHEMFGLACENCDYADYSPVARSYSDVTAYDCTTGEEYTVTGVSISQEGMLTFTFKGKTYRLTLYADHADSTQWMLLFDCYVNGRLEPNAVLEIDTTDYMPRLTWWELQECNLYFYAQ